LGSGSASSSDELRIVKGAGAQISGIFSKIHYLQIMIHCYSPELFVLKSHYYLQNSREHRNFLRKLLFQKI